MLKTGKGLEGAEFGVYEDEALTTSLRTIRSDENGTVTLSNLSYGEVYYLKETKAPSGYVAGNTVYKVVVDLRAVQQQQKCLLSVIKMKLL